VLLFDLPEVDHTGISHKIADALLQEGVIDDSLKPQILQ
jgi:hypothetical protein